MLRRSVLGLEPAASRFSSEEFEHKFSVAIHREISSGPDANYWATFTDFEHELRHTGNVRRIFWTGKGYLGIGAQTLGNDDEVWILGGADKLMVLRKLRSGSYTLIGEAYLHGVMHGEAAQSVK